MTTIASAQYQSRRLAIVAKTQDTAYALWIGRNWGDKSTFLDHVVPVVEGAITALVNQLNAYYNLKAGMAAGTAARPKTLVDPKDYHSTSDYKSIFGRLGLGLANGLTFREADELAGQQVIRLVSTDIQIAQVQASRDWIESYSDNIGFAPRSADTIAEPDSRWNWHNGDLIVSPPSE